MSGAAIAPVNASAGVQVRVRLARGADFLLDVDTALPGQGITAICGPSGCGKTTLLRAIAGLIRPQPGRVVVGGQTWQDDAHALWLPTHRRPLGLVFQEASLFEHLTVQGNLDFGLKRVPAHQRRIALPQVVELLGIGHLLARWPAQLSGGERQRVAIARALATSPRLLLLDEPLAALDDARKTELLPWFQRLSEQWQAPMLYVTHSLDEVARLASHVLLMQAGRVTAQGPVAELLARLDVAQRHGDAASALIEGRVSRVDAHYHLLHVAFAGGQIVCIPPANGTCPQPGQPVRLRIQARDVSLTLHRPQDTSILNALPATVLALADDGRAQTLAALDIGGATTLLARITRQSAHTLALAPGLPVYAQVKSVAVLD